CVMEIFYLFSVRYMYSTSFTWRGTRGTPAVLWAVFTVVVAQLVFTYVPVMHVLFDSRPVPLFEGAVIVALGLLLMVLLEAEKWVLRRLDIFEELR
ncbi:MAG TPA: cation transporting ATPase C-terminal domain-containing protein, partial [Burkholderiaceae bacterium]|nr:cation transporting ATPase C-terminal domain-containing protein [Burkholderiaceae bacterium]